VLQKKFPVSTFLCCVTSVQNFTGFFKNNHLIAVMACTTPLYNSEVTTVYKIDSVSCKHLEAQWEIFSVSMQGSNLLYPLHKVIVHKYCIIFVEARLHQLENSSVL